jgi:site-specific recombinase XerD
LYQSLRAFAERERKARPERSSERIFVGLRRREGEYSPLTRGGLQQIVHDLGERAGIGKRVYPHLFRHSFATEALHRGVNPVTLAEILGHKDLTMILRVYSHLSPRQTYDALQKAFGRDEED